MINLLLYVHGAELQARYMDSIKLLDIKCEVINSFDEFYGHAAGNKYSGILVDIVSSIRASACDRDALKGVMEVYPTLRLRWDPEAKDIRTLMSGAGVGQKISIEYFVNTYCSVFHPQALRLQRRQVVYCSVVSANNADIAIADTLRTIIADISVGGCFLYSAYPIAIGTVLWLRFVDMVDDTPIKCEVMWGREWGKTKMIPGAGLKFVEITDEQAVEIDCLMADLPMAHL